MAWLQQTPGSGGRASPTVFEQQREELVREIAVVCTNIYELPTLSAAATDANLFAQGMEQVLQNINRLNRNLESVIAVRFTTRTGRASTNDIIRWAMNLDLWKLSGPSLRISWAGLKNKARRLAMAM